LIGDCLVTISGIGLIIQNWPDNSPSPTTFPSDPPPLNTPPFEFPPFDEDFGLGDFGDFAPIPGFDHPIVPPSFPPPFPDDGIFDGPLTFPKGDCGDLIPPFFDIDGAGDGNRQQPLGRGSTGRAEPADLFEQLALEQAMSNREDGEMIPIIMTDPRWPASDGWVKMRQNINGVEIHYVENLNTGEIDDFKFK